MVESGNLIVIVDWELITFNPCLEPIFVACLILSPTVQSTTRRDIRLVFLRCAGIKDTREYCRYWQLMPLGLAASASSSVHKHLGCIIGH